MVVEAMLEARLGCFRRNMAEQARKPGLDARHGMRGSWFSLKAKASFAQESLGL